MIEARSVSLDTQDWKTIQDADTNQAGVSATLRRIVREWHALHQAIQPAAGRVLVDTRETYSDGS
jgi:hypothetical protein